MFRLCAVFLACIVIAGCSSTPREVKSPCAGAAGSPCERRPANEGWVS